MKSENTSHVVMLSAIWASCMSCVADRSCVYVFAHTDRVFMCLRMRIYVYVNVYVLPTTDNVRVFRNF
jgi:hypothetical protein